MAVIKTSYHEIETSNPTDKESVTTELVALMTKYGFGRSSVSEGEVLTLSGCSNVGVYVTYNGYIGSVCKGANDKWYTPNGIHSYLAKTNRRVRLGILSINGLMRYTIQTMSSTDYGPGEVYAAVSLVDYFTGKNRIGLLENQQFYWYDDSIRKMVSLKIVPVGGGEYPKDWNYVATPMMLASKEGFYGYINSPSSFYQIWKDGKQWVSDYAIPRDVEITDIKGHAFQEILRGIYARL